MSHKIASSLLLVLVTLVNKSMCCAVSLGTSNWSGDYFMKTAGVGLVISQDAPPPVWKTELQNQLGEVFNRDWNSEFAIKLTDLGHHPDCTL